jgi:DNA-binding IclR family transcriptional regulator
MVRRKGFAFNFNDEEQYLGIRAVAAAVKNHDCQVVGAINIVGPIFRFSHTTTGKSHHWSKAVRLKYSEAWDILKIEHTGFKNLSYIGRLPERLLAQE